MPDWTYQTLLKPPLSALGFDRGTALALGTMGRLASCPGGNWLIQLLGHMHPDPRLGHEKKGHEKKDIWFPARVGIGCGIDPHLLATRAFAEFGVGHLEIGPIVDDPISRNPAADSSASPPPATELDFAAETIQYHSPAKFLRLNQAATKIAQCGALPVPIFARLETESPAAALKAIESLQQQVDGFVVPATVVAGLAEQLISEQCDAKTTLLIALDHAAWRNDEVRDQVLKLLQLGVASGISVSAGTLSMGKINYPETVSLVHDIRREIGSEPLLIGTSGVHSPADALDYLEAGADLVQVDSGLVFAGPSLPKRINEAILYREFSPRDEPASERPWPQQSWFWSFLMGLGMFVGGLMAMSIALTRVVMPYDESLVGMLRHELVEINDRLLPFMQHDRVTLAGTMLAIGLLYIALACFGIRRGAQWASFAVIVSAAAGFFSFFTFLGFGYFDPFHAFVSAVLLQFLLLTTILPLPEHRRIAMPDLWNDSRWRLHQWGQLAFVIHGAVLIVAGLVISAIGMTSVFVPEDLEFLRCSERVLTEANPMLVPLVAHDRATFGGMLIACGLATLLSALWGFRHGQAWQWWALMLAGNIAYLSTLGVHWAVEYNSLKHLAPAYGGLALLWAGGLASYRFMVSDDPELTAEWQHRQVIASDARSSLKVR